MKREFQFEDGEDKGGRNDDYGSRNKNDFGGGFGREERSHQSYESRSQATSKPKGGWDDVRRAEDRY